MRKFSRSALVAVLISAITVGGLALSAGPASAADPDPSVQDTARLLGYMWGDGSYDGGVWDVNGPSGTSSLIEELVEAHGGTWVNRSKLTFTLPAPYDWVDWKDGVPDDSTHVRNAVQDPNFLAAVMEAEAAVDGQIYDQSACCVDGFTRGRLTELRDLMRDSGYSTTALVPFNNVDSGKITIGSSEFAELRAASAFACPTAQSAIRVPGGTNLNAYGDLNWIQAGDRWGDVVRSDCTAGEPVPDPTTQPGSCSVSADGNTVNIDWTFTLGDAAIRRDGGYVTTVSGRDGSWSQTRADGQYTYEVRLIAFGVKTTVNCGTVSVPGDGGPAPAGPCVVTESGNDVLVSWDDFGKLRYSVRRNGSWAATITNGAQSTVVDGSLNDTYELRYSDAGVRQTVPCTTGGVTPPAGPCSVVAQGGGVLVSWDAIAGVSDYQVRRNGSWRATVSNTTTFADANGSTGDDYIIRYRKDGVRTDLNCN